MITPELKADVRRRFETADEPLSSLAADLGCSTTTLRDIAKRESWVRYVGPPRDLSPAARLLARAEKLANDRHPEKHAEGSSDSLRHPEVLAEGEPRRMDGPNLEDLGRRPSRLAASPLAPQGDGESLSNTELEAPPPSTLPAIRCANGGGEENAAPPAQEIAATPTPTLALSGGASAEAVAAAAEQEIFTDIAQALLAEVQRQIAELNAMRAQGKPLAIAERERVARTLAVLTRTLHLLQAMRCGAPLTESHADNDYDDMPADIDEFRNQLARRIATFMESRPDEGDAVQADAAGTDAV